MLKIIKYSNNVIRENVNIKNSVLDYIRYKHLNWYDHVKKCLKKGYLEKEEEEGEKEDIQIRGCKK